MYYETACIFPHIDNTVWFLTSRRIASYRHRSGDVSRLIGLGRLQPQIDQFQSPNYQIVTAAAEVPLPISCLRVQKCLIVHCQLIHFTGWLQKMETYLLGKYSHVRLQSGRNLKRIYFQVGFSSTKYIYQVKIGSQSRHFRVLVKIPKVS